MNSNNKTQVVKNLKEKSVLVSREFNAPLPEVWSSFTEKEFLDKWWGPAPWRAETKIMDFKPGGYWLYAMVGPENEKHWARMDYNAIDHHKSMEIKDSFCDENGNINSSLPVSKGSLVFTQTANGTKVDFKMIYDSEEEVKKIIEMGFEQGITKSFEQLDELLKKQIA